MRLCCGSSLLMRAVDGVALLEELLRAWRPLVCCEAGTLLFMPGYWPLYYSFKLPHLAIQTLCSAKARRQGLESGLLYGSL
jgi:hypothetical protein